MYMCNAIALGAIHVPVYFGQNPRLGVKKFTLEAMVCLLVVYWEMRLYQH